MKGWGRYETVETPAKPAPEPDPDLYYEVARGMDRVKPDERVDIEIRRGSVTVRRIGSHSVHTSTEIEAHELAEDKVCDAVKDAIDD